MAKVVITKNKLDSLANSIAAKSGVPVTLTLNQMKTAVDGILVPNGTISVTENGTVNVAQYENANINVPVPEIIDEVTVKSTDKKQIIIEGTTVLSNYQNNDPTSRYIGMVFDNKKYYIETYFGMIHPVSQDVYTAIVKQKIDFSSVNSVELIYEDINEFNSSLGFSEYITSITLNKTGYYSFTYTDLSEEPGMLVMVNVIKEIGASGYESIKVEPFKLRSLVNVIPSDGYQFIKPGYSDDVIRTLGTLDSNETLNSTGQLPSFYITVNNFQCSGEMPPYYYYRVSGQIDISDSTSSISMGINTMFCIIVGEAYKKIPYEIISVNDEYHGWGQQHDLKINYGLTSTQEYIYLTLESFIIGSPGGTTVSAQLTVTENYPYDALSEVQVEPIPSNYIQPSGTISITSNGTVDVSQYENASVNVSGAVGIADVTSTLANGATQHSITAVDLSNDTVDAAHLASGYTAHDSSGQAVTGTMESVSLTTKTVTPSEYTQYVFGDNCLEQIIYTVPISDHIDQGTNSTSSITITPSEILNTGERYRIYGEINVIGTGDVILDTYNIDATFIWNTGSQTIFTGDSDAYFYFFRIYKQSTTSNNISIKYSYKKTGRYGIKFNLIIYEITEYDGLSQVTVNPVPDTYYSPDLIKKMIQRDTSFTTFNFPDGIARIGEYTFANCQDLALTSLPSGITYIGDYAFYNCQDLALTSLPSGITLINPYAFYNCKKLALTSLPSGITSINSYVFNNCQDLALTSLPSGITSINKYAFYNCKKLALTSLPSSLTTLESSCFNNCTSLALTSLPSGLTTIGSSVFRNCTSLALTSLPSSLTTLESSCFNNCTSLALTSLPSSLTFINTYAFQGCTGLTTISSTGRITTLATNVFIGDSTHHMQLTSARFPNMALSSNLSYVFGSTTAANACQELEICDIGITPGIAVNAFANCYKLQTLILRKTSVCTLAGTSAFTNTPLSGYNGLTATVYVPSSLISSYQTASNWSTLYNAGNVTFSAIEGSEYELE